MKTTIWAEIERSPRLTRAARAAIVRAHHVRPDATSHEPRPALPLTESGKIDRRALPAPDEGERLGTSEAFVDPRSSAEEELSRIWASVLRLPEVGIHDNFFEIGGDSIQIISRAQLAGLIYSENRHEKATIEALARRYTEALAALIAHCVSPEARGVTPSDFEDAGLSQEALDMLVGVVDDDDLS
jgi:hypothetical protein